MDGLCIHIWLQIVRLLYLPNIQSQQEKRILNGSMVIVKKSIVLCRKFEECNFYVEFVYFHTDLFLQRCTFVSVGDIKCNDVFPVYIHTTQSSTLCSAPPINTCREEFPTTTTLYKCRSCFIYYVYANMYFLRLLMKLPRALFYL